jgi:hypothetical protein
MKLDVKVASVDALDAVMAKPGRICPLICDHGFKADGERCVKIGCGAGLFLNEDNECEKKRTAPRRPEAKQVPQPKQVIVRRPQEPASPQTVENPWGGGCNAPSAKISGKC